jgi:hypothetical protein
MPRSIVVYTSRQGFSDLSVLLEGAFAGQSIKPFTVSRPQRTESESVRVRITELVDDAVLPLLRRQAGKSKFIFASSTDREVRNESYEGLMGDASRFERTAAIQFVSPTIVPVLRQETPFPVVLAMFSHYWKVWGVFSNRRTFREKPLAGAVRITDFKISCVSTPYGIGFQGWVVLEIETGRTEAEIGLFNALINFAFYSGTGLHTENGLGQTKRMDSPQQRTIKPMPPAG